MPITAAKIGYGVKFSIGNSSGGGSTTYTDVGEVVDITTPEMTRAAEEATHLESPDQYREYIAGLLEGGEASVVVNHVPSATDVFYAALHAGAGDFRITYVNAVKMDFSGIVTSFNPGQISNDKMTSSMGVKVSGKPTLT